MRYLVWLVALAVAGCAHDREAENDGAVGTGRGMAPMVEEEEEEEGSGGRGGGAGELQSAYDSTFVRQASSANLFEIKSSQLLLEQADPTSEMQSYAEQIIQDHQRVGQKLEEAAQAAGLQVPDQMMPSDQQKIDELENISGADLTTAYQRLQAATHQSTINMFQRCASGCTTRELREFASATIPVLQDHQRALPSPSPSMSSSRAGGMGS